MKSPPPIKSICELLPATLKRSQLQRLAILVGAPLTGTKPQLRSGIYDLLKTTDQKRNDFSAIDKHGGGGKGKNFSNSPGTGTGTGVGTDTEKRVLSIDMGIRNLAFAFLTVGGPKTGRRSPTTKKTKIVNQVQAVVEKNSPNTTDSPIPTLHCWQRSSLTQLNLLNTGTSIDTNNDIELSPTSPAITPAPAEPLSPAVKLAQFDPVTLSSHAYRFAKHCLSFRPTHILIERQRFRSGGGSAVQEWSLRVGMLEAMLYATFHTLRVERANLTMVKGADEHVVGANRGETATGIEVGVEVIPVLPMRVNKFWFQDAEASTTGKQAKIAKIAMVARMIGAAETMEEVFRVGEDAEKIVAVFGGRHRGADRDGDGGADRASSGKMVKKKGRKMKADKEEGSDEPDQNESIQGGKALVKFDDMADSLLQGLAWIKWCENREKILDGGVEEFDLGE